MTKHEEPITAGPQFSQGAKYDLCHYGTAPVLYREPNMTYVTVGLRLCYTESQT